jgi:hypothetical protein
VLAAWNRGLGSVINGQGIMRSDIVREVAKIPQEQVIITCVAMGYPDASLPPTASAPTAKPTAISCATWGLRTSALSPSLRAKRSNSADRAGERAPQERACPASWRALQSLVAAHPTIGDGEAQPRRRQAGRRCAHARHPAPLLRSVRLPC